MNRSRVRRVVTSIAAVGLLLGGSACETIPGPDEMLDATQFSTDLSLMELANTLDVEAARVEITLYRQGVVVRNLEIGSAESLQDDERVEGRIVAIERNEGGGFIELNIEGLRIAFDENTQFVVRQGELELDSEAFAARIQGALAENARPAIEATRLAPNVPQAPDDEGFTAKQIRLLGEGEGRIIEMNIDRDNLVRNPDGFPDGWITLLDREFEIRIREGITHLERERPNLEKVRFEGLVESVNLDRRSFVIKDGPEVRLITGETDVRYETGDQHRLASLEEVARALENGHRVHTAGVGVVESEEPLKLIAIKVVFELQPPPMEDFEGLVKEVDLDDSTVTLEDGLIVRITGETHVRFGATDHAQLLGSLEAVARALEGGLKVFTAGVGTIAQEEPLILEAVKIVFVVRPPPQEEFRGRVEAVDLIDSTVTLVSGTLIKVTAETVISFGHLQLSEHRLGTLEAVFEALEAGRKVVAAGIGEIESKEPLVIVAKRMLFVLEPPEHIAFHGVVVEVNIDAHTFTLRDGPVVRINDETVVWFQSADLHSLRTLAAVAEAIEDGHVVVAAGVGKPDVISTANTETARLLAVRVGFYLVAPGIQHFHGTVTEVDLDDSSFTLDNGTIVRVVEGTKILHANGNSSLESLEVVARVVRAGGRVKAVGVALLETSDPLVLIAVAVLFRV